MAPEADAFTFAQIAGHTGVTVETENLSGVTSANQMFTSCGSLETIYATSFSNTGLSGSLMFNSCNRLVGGTDGFVPSTTSSASVCKLGAGGVLTDPNNDNRTWLWAHYYANGEGVLTASSAPDPTRELVASGRICCHRQVRGPGLHALGRRHRADAPPAPHERDLRDRQEEVMDNEYSDVSGEKLDPEWFKWVIHKQGWSIRRLGADRDIGKTDKTIRRAIKAEGIRPELLDRIAKKLDVYPPYLAGRYAWTLKLSIMDEEGVCDYWQDTYLDPKHFVSLCFANSIEDVLRNYFLRFAAYQNVVLQCLGNEVTPSLEASTSRNNEMVKFGSDTPKFNHLFGRLVSRENSDSQDDR